MYKASTLHYIYIYNIYYSARVSERILGAGLRDLLVWEGHFEKVRFQLAPEILEIYGLS